MGMYNIGGSGTGLLLLASKTFPVGFSITAPGKDNDPFEIGDLEIGDAEKDMNGNVYHWKLQNMIDYTISVAAETDEYKNLQILAIANTGIGAASDIITVVATFPNGATQSLISGTMTTGTIANGVSSDGKLKPGSWKFKFGDIATTPALS